MADQAIEVGYHEGFERGWRRAELIGHGLMLLFVLGAGAGLLGSGPLSHRSLTTADGQLRVDYEPIARYGTSTQVTFHLVPEAGGKAHLFLSSEMVEPLGLQRVVPTPDSAAPVGGGIEYTFTLPRGRALVRLMLKPDMLGSQRVGAHADGAALSWVQTVVP